ncbi:MAG: hypothetical protein OHK0057_06040 [Thermoflexibacter sp.]
MFKLIAKIQAYFQHESFAQKSHAVFLFFLSLANFLFVGYLFHLSFYNRLAMDDFTALCVFNEHGIMGGVADFYQHWSGRFASVWLMLVAIQVYVYLQNLAFWTFFLVFAYSITFFYVFYLALKSLINNHKDYFLMLNLAIFLFIIFVITNYNFSTFYWFCASIGYFGGVLFASILAVCLFSSSTHFFVWTGLILCSLFVGSAVENIAILCGLLLSIGLVFSFSKYSLFFFNQRTKLNQSKWLTAWIVHLSSFVIAWFSSGTRARLATSQVLNWTDFLWQVRKSVPYFFHDIAFSKINYLLLLALVMCYVGVYFRKKEIEPQQEIKLISELLLGIIVLFVFVLVCILPIVYAFANIEPNRTLTIVAFLLMIFIAYFAFQLGYQTFFPKKLALVLAVLALMALVYEGRYRWVNEVKGAKIYAQEYDAQVKHLLELKAKKNREPVGLKPITLPPGSLERNSFYADTAYWLNRDFAKAYELGFAVYSK